MTEKEECQICVSERVKRTMITCPKCNIVCCQGCVKKFLLSSSLQNPTCMGCKVGWDLDFVISNTDSSFDDTYREYRASIILSLEKSLIPSTQEDALKELKKRQSFEFLYDSNLNIRKIKKWIKENKGKRVKYLKKHENFKEKDPEKSKKYFDKYINVLHKIDQCNDTISQIEKSMNLEKTRVFDEAQKSGCEKSKEIKTRYICPCPQDGCKGFIDDTEYKCGICEKAVCKRCQTPQHDDEKCNADTVETVKMMKKETKPCPNCKIPIFKIDGCDQIWCTSCHTAFSWNTGEIETGRIHNPHYYQWMRENGVLQRERGDIQGCGLVQLATLLSRARKFNVQDSVFQYLINCHRISLHIREVMLPTVGERDLMEARKYIRIRYMLGDFNERRWLSQLKAREKTHEIRRAISLLLTMCVNTLEDLLGNIVSCNNTDDFESFVFQIRGLHKYVIDSSLKLKKRFKTNIVSFDEEWNQIYV